MPPGPPGQPGWLGIDTGHFTHRSDPDFKFIYRGRIRRSAGRRAAKSYYFNCTLPSQSAHARTRRSSIARGLACARATASCGIATARRTGSRDCKGITDSAWSRTDPQGQMAPVSRSSRAASPRAVRRRHAASAATQAPPTRSMASRLVQGQLNHSPGRRRGDSARRRPTKRSAPIAMGHAPTRAGDRHQPARGQTAGCARLFGRCSPRRLRYRAQFRRPDAAAAANAFNVDEVMAAAFSFAGLAVGIAGVSGMYMPVAGADHAEQPVQHHQPRAARPMARRPGYVGPRTVPSDITAPRDRPHEHMKT